MTRLQRSFSSTGTENLVASRRAMVWGARLLGQAKEVLRQPAAEVAGEWLIPEDAARELPTVLYLHGGAYVFGEPATHRWMTTRIAASGVRVLALDYRLAPEHPFPAAVNDAIEAYRILVERSDPERLFVVGDSAGGGLTLSLLIAVREAGLPQPAGAVLVSPWTDLTGKARSMQGHPNRDYLSPEFLLRKARSYAGENSLEHPLVSPVFAELHGLAPLLIQVGGREILLDDSLRVAEKIREAHGEVTLSLYPEETHVWHQHFWWRSASKQSIA